MSLAKVRKQISFYLQRPVTDFVVDGEDVLLSELNEARRDLEKLHNFRSLFDQGTFALTSSGFDLRTLTTTSSRKFKSIRSIEHANLPIVWLSEGAERNRQLKRLRRRGMTSSLHHPGDVGNSFSDSDLLPRLVVDGFKVLLRPTGELDQVLVKCHTWAPAWSNYDDSSSFFATECVDYLKWATILRLNKFTQTFTDMRQEGTISERAIEKMVASSIELLKSSDNYDGAAGRIIAA